MRRTAIALEIRLLTAPGLHATPCGEAGDAVRGDAVAEVVAEAGSTVGVFAREVEQVDTREDNEKAAEEGDCVYGGGGVEALEKEAGGNEGAGCEGYIVEGVDAVDC